MAAARKTSKDDFPVKTAVGCVSVDGARVQIVLAIHTDAARLTLNTGRGVGFMVCLLAASAGAA